MGINTITSSKKILVLATGEGKAKVVRTALEGGQDTHVPVSVLQSHRDTTFLLDSAAAEYLECMKQPWKNQIDFDWTPYYAKKATIQVAQAVKLPIQQLDVRHFHQHHLHELVGMHHSVGKLCRSVVDDLMRRVYYDERLPSKNERVLIFSPHPDDDVICMGATMQKMQKNGADLQVAYMTNGFSAFFSSCSLSACPHT